MGINCIKPETKPQEFIIEDINISPKVKTTFDLIPQKNKPYINTSKKISMKSYHFIFNELSNPQGDFNESIISQRSQPSSSRSINSCSRSISYSISLRELNSLISYSVDRSIPYNARRNMGESEDLNTNNINFQNISNAYGIQEIYLRENFSSNLSQLSQNEIEEKNFNGKLFIDLNLTRKNYKEFLEKIEQLEIKIETLDNNSNNDAETKTNYNLEQRYYINLISNDKIFKFYINNIDTISKAKNFLENIEGNLFNMKFIEDLEIEFPKEFFNEEKFAENSRNLVNDLVEKTKVKYKIISVHYIYLDTLEDPDLANMMALIDGENHYEMLKNFFSKDITHIYINNKKTKENERVVFYLFAKLI